jgi:hypothetical protein
VSKLNSIRVWPDGIHGIFKRIRVNCRQLVLQPFFEYFFILIVLLNCVILVFNSFGLSYEVQNALDTLSEYLNYIFISEMVIKIYTFGIKKYCKDIMNLLDGTVVTITVFEIIYNYILSSQNGSSNLEALKTIRLLRTLRILRITRLLRKFRTI